MAASDDRDTGPVEPVVEGGGGVRDPEELEATGGPAEGVIAPRTTMGAVHLTVADLDRSLAYYRERVGIEPIGESNGGTALGVGGRELLVLTEEPGAQPSASHTGLYHFALLVPARVDLARWLAHAARERVPLTGLSDHYVSEAIYLRDPDGHGIEIYADRPREVWEGQVAERMTTEPLDVDDLIAEVDDPATEPFDGLAGGTVMGHVHLRVAEIPGTIEFYRDLLGFGLMAELFSTAAFLAAGGYHHHLGANTWESRGAPPPPPGTAALRHAEIILPDIGERRRMIDRLEGAGVEVGEADGAPLVRDPSGNGLALVTG